MTEGEARTITRERVLHLNELLDAVEEDRDRPRQRDEDGGRRGR